MKALFYFYRNLNKQGHFSLKHRGKVIDHPVAIKMANPIFKVSIPGQNRVRRERRKNVHAMVGADNYHIIESDCVDLSGYREVYYCPYQCDTFIIKSTGEPVFSADEIIGINNKVYIP